MKNEFTLMNQIFIGMHCFDWPQFIPTVNIFITERQVDSDFLQIFVNICISLHL